MHMQETELSTNKESFHTDSRAVLDELEACKAETLMLKRDLVGPASSGCP